MTADALLRPALVDGILVLLAAESGWLALRDRRRGGAGFAGSFAVAGAGLLVALRAVLAAWPAWVALAGLAVAGAGNAWHVARHRARRDTPPHAAQPAQGVSRLATPP